MVYLFSNPFRAQYYTSGGVAGDSYGGLWYSTGPMDVPQIQVVTAADEGGTWVINRVSQPAYHQYADNYLNRVEINTYYDAESNTTVVPYYYALNGFSAGSSAYNAYDYVVLGGTTMQVFGQGYYEADPVGVTKYGTSWERRAGGRARPRRVVRPCRQ